MSIRLYADEFRCAIYEEAPGGGDPANPNSLMNRPVIDPYSWVDNIRFHSDFYYLGIEKTGTATISHPAVPTITRQVGYAMNVVGQTVTNDYLLLTHDLGYVPNFFCLYNNRLIPAGQAVQFVGAGNSDARRYVTAYATTTQIRVFELAYSSSLSLPAINVTYRAIVFREQTLTPDGYMLSMKPGEVIFGQGKFRSDYPPLRADGAGDQVWPLATSPTGSVANGGFRGYEAGGGYIDSGPYNGSAPAPSYLTTSSGVV